MKTKKVAIIGASGYSGEELVKLLLHHPHAELAAVTSRQYAGQTLAQIFPKFAHHPKSRSLRFVEPNAELIEKQADVVFLALPHGVAAEFAVPLLNAGCVVIDLSADFRLKSADIYKDFYAHDHPAPDLLKKAVYGLPEIYRDEIKKSLLIASPGCYPTSILLPMIPLLKTGLVRPAGIIADSLSGVSGAGRKAEIDYLFCECNESVRPYGVPKHRHLSEIEEQLSFAAGTQSRHPVHAASDSGEPRHFDDALSHAGKIHRRAKKSRRVTRRLTADEPFVRLLEGKALPDTKNVVGTNVFEIAWRLDPRTGRLIVMSAEDNLVKGASGQAVQSMNLICGFPETAGLI